MKSSKLTFIALNAIDQHFRFSFSSKASAYTTDMAFIGSIFGIAGFWDAPVLRVPVVQGPKEAFRHLKAGGSWKVESRSGQS